MKVAYHSISQKLKKSRKSLKINASSTTQRKNYYRNAPQYATGIEYLNSSNLAMLTPNFKPKLSSPQKFLKFLKKKNSTKIFDFNKIHQEIGNEDPSPIDYSLGINEALFFGSENSETISKLFSKFKLQLALPPRNSVKKVSNMAFEKILVENKSFRPRADSVNGKYT